jgi:NHL repeat-containing protein
MFALRWFWDTYSKSSRILRLSLTAGILMGGGVFAGLAVSGGASATSVAQSITVTCPASDQVKPTLNSNLISNPGAEDTTPFPASYGLTASSSNEHEPDCWTISSQSSAPGGILSALPYVPTTGNGQSGKPANPKTSDPDKGNYLFYGGISAGTAAQCNQLTFGTQTVDLSSLNAGDQPFLLSAYLGGTTTQSDYDQVSVVFENASGQVLDPNIPFGVGPVTAAERGDVTSLIPVQTTGYVPAGATQAVVTITSTQIGGCPADNDGMADDLNLTIGESVTVVPALATLPYTFPAGTGGSLTWPAGVSVSGGKVYVSNTGDNVLSSLDGSTTATVAGNLEGHGEHGDGGPAASSTLAAPGGTAEDSHGDIFIADTEDNVVREIHAGTGVITRFAGTGVAGHAGLGGKAAHAQLDSPDAVAVNAAGDVLISDTYGNRVDEVLPDGHIRAFAGDGVAGYEGDGHVAAKAELNQPAGLAVDKAGDVYIADAANNVVRKVDARTGIITTVAGDYAADKANDGLGGFSGDGGPATSAQLYDPEGVAVDGAGDLFIADTFNNAVREVTPAGAISTVVNSAGANGTRPPSGGEIAGVATSSRLNGPAAVVVDDSTGALYIADTSNSKVAAVTGLVHS